MIEQATSIYRNARTAPSRTREGMRVAKAKGHLRGKQPKLNPRQEAHLVKLLHSGEYPTAEIGDLFGVARSTVHRASVRSKRVPIDSRPPAVKTPAAPAPQKPSISDGNRNTATVTYRPRHGAASEIPSQNRNRSGAQMVRPASAPRTGR